MAEDLFRSKLTVVARRAFASHLEAPERTQARIEDFAKRGLEDTIEKERAWEASLSRGQRNKLKKDPRPFWLKMDELTLNFIKGEQEKRRAELIVLQGESLARDAQRHTPYW